MRRSTLAVMDFFAPHVIDAFMLTLMAGLATCVGSVLLLFTNFQNMRFMALSLAFSAGAMVYVSLVEILPKAQTVMNGHEHAALIALMSFFSGMLLFAVIDRLVPNDINPHHTHPHEKDVIEHHSVAPPRRRLLRIGLLTMLVISAHNVPEGMVTFFSALQDPNLGLVIAVAIAVHNIPEGISVSVPVYYATGSRLQAFLTALASALAEPVGAILGYAALHNYLDGPVLGIVFGLIAGMMVALSLDELLPFARKYSKGHETQYGIFAGMLVMAASLYLFTI